MFQLQVVFLNPDPFFLPLSPQTSLLIVVLNSELLADVGLEEDQNYYKTQALTGSVGEYIDLEGKITLEDIKNY